MAIPFSNKADVKTNLQGIETKQKKRKKERKKDSQRIHGLRISLLNLARQTKHFPNIMAEDNTVIIHEQLPSNYQFTLFIIKSK